MVAPNLKAETISLMDRRASIEAQMNAIIGRLCGSGCPGITGNLIDSEGFPRSDIDIPVVRADRQRLSELRNDYKDITNKIDQNLQVLHSAKISPNVSLFASNSVAFTSTSSHAEMPHDAVTVMEEDAIVRIPFAVVDEITEESPAAEDGLQLGDLIVKFGNVDFGDELLRRLASEAQLNQGKPVPVMIMRQGSPINITITPRQWHGRGLLGCHFRIL